MKVLMTGASGFIGSNVLQFMLNNTDWDFTIICSFRHMGSPLNIPLSNRVHVYTADLTGHIPPLGEFDYILHLASESHVDRSMADPVGFIENNVSSTLQILEYARHYGCKKFILFSTDEVYGARRHKDWDYLMPTNPYAASKAAQEMIAAAYFNTYKVPVIITNSNNIIGPNQQPEKFVPKLIKLIKAGETVELHKYKGKYGKRFYNPVQNVASALIFILKQSYKNENQLPTRYSLTGGKQLDNMEMAQLIAKKLGKALKYKSVSATSVRSAYDAFYTESDDNLLKLQGWRTPYTLEDGLRWIK